MAAKKASAKTKAKKEYKLDIREVLRRLDNGEHGWFQGLDDEQRAAFEPFVVMRYLSASPDDDDLDLKAFTLRAVNDAVNVRFADMTKHPELQWKLMASCGLGWSRYHPWVPPGGRTKKTNRVDALLRRYAPGASAEEIAVLKRVNTPEDILALAEGYALPDGDLADLRKELGLGK